MNVTLYIHKTLEPTDFEDAYPVYPFDISEMAHHRGKVVLLGTQEVEVEIPDVDTTPLIIERLEDQLERMMTEARAEQQKLRDRIASLRCLEHQPEGRRHA